MMQLYITRMKCLFRNKETMFWNLLFPIALGSFFFFALRNIYSVEDFKTIPMAYVKEGEATPGLKETLETIKVNDNTEMFDIREISREEASLLLKEGEIDGYLIDNHTIELIVKKSGLKETIMKSFLDQWQRTQNIAANILEDNPTALQDGLIMDLMQQKDYLKEKENKKAEKGFLLYFYTLIAFSCIMASNYGVEQILDIQGNQSMRAARLNASPVNKMKLFLSSTAASYTAHLLGQILLFLYLYFILKIEFGKDFGRILLLCLLGNLVGLFIGSVVGVLSKKGASFKMATVMSITMIGSFLSGMMYPDIRLVILKNAPVITVLNPVGLITDALYSLYYYDTYQMYMRNMIILSVFAVVLGTITYLGIRRRTYASI